MRRLAVSLPAVLLLASLAACGGSDDPEEGSDATPTETVTVTTPADEPTETETAAVDDVPPTVEEAEDAPDDVSWDPTSCGTAPGTQDTFGTVTNSSDRTADFLVQVSWVDSADTVLDLGWSVIQDLSPGKTVPWKASAEVPDGATTCVIDVQRGVIG